MKIIKTKISLIIYTFTHFCVDFSCFFILFYCFKKNISNPEILTLGFLTYNIIAFGTQPLIGYICDVKKNIPIAFYSCIIIAFGLLFTSFPWLSLIICAFGNACFHVGGGIDSLVYSDGKMLRSGIFVSTGALGLTLGTLAGQYGYITPVIPIILIISCCLFIKYFIPNSHTNCINTRFYNTSSVKSISVILTLCFITIILRSYIGFNIPLKWRTTTLLILISSIATCLGKAFGGCLADIFGAKNIGVLSLLMSIPFLCFGYNNPILCTIGILLFNMTMPITLCAIAEKLPKNPGLAFGTTTLCLLCGNIPTYFYALPNAYLIPTISSLIIISTICIYLSITNQKGVCIYEKTFD